MKRRKIMLTALFLSAVLTLGACNNDADTGTGSTTDGNDSQNTEDTTDPNTDVNEEIVDMYFLYPGEETDSMEEFMDNDFNPRMEEELNIRVNMIYVPWDAYWSQKDIMLAAQEDTDLYWDGLPSLSSLINKDQAQPIDDLLAEYAPDLTNVIPETHLDGARVNGELYGIPSSYSSSSGMYQYVVVRQDLLEGVGMDTLNTPEDLREYARLVDEQYPDILGPADTIHKPLTRFFQPEQYTFIARDDISVYAEESGVVLSYYETEAFQEVAKFNESMFDQGLYLDELSTNYNERTSRIQTGLYIWGEGSVGKDQEIQGAVEQNVPDAVLQNHILAPEKDRYVTSTGGEVLAIPHSAQNPEAALKFINWIYANEDNYLLAVYGVEGEDFELTDEGRIIRHNTNDFFYEWMFRNKNYQKFGEEVSQEYIDEYLTLDDNAKTSDMIGFVFDSSEVTMIETAIVEVAGQQLAPIRDGFISFEDNYDNAIQALKDAGIDEYIAEVQRQVDEFLASKE